jgi:predicted transcriptional regulator of viral defense system
MTKNQIPTQMASKPTILRKSVKLTKEQRRKFTAFVKSHHTLQDACDVLDLTPTTVRRIMTAGTASSATIDRIFTDIVLINQ